MKLLQWLKCTVFIFQQKSRPQLSFIDILNTHQTFCNPLLSSNWFVTSRHFEFAVCCPCRVHRRKIKISDTTVTYPQMLTKKGCLIDGKIRYKSEFVGLKKLHNVGIIVRDLEDVDRDKKEFEGSKINYVTILEICGPLCVLSPNYLKGFLKLNQVFNFFSDFIKILWIFCFRIRSF